jgi:hypothetical protein
MSGVGAEVYRSSGRLSTLERYFGPHGRYMFDLAQSILEGLARLVRELDVRHRGPVEPAAPDQPLEG